MATWLWPCSIDERWQHWQWDFFSVGPCGRSGHTCWQYSQFSRGWNQLSLVPGVSQGLMTLEVPRGVGLVGIGSESPWRVWFKESVRATCQLPSWARDLGPGLLVLCLFLGCRSRCCGYAGDSVGEWWPRPTRLKVGGAAFPGFVGNHSVCACGGVGNIGLGGQTNHATDAWEDLGSP